MDDPLDQPLGKPHNLFSAIGKYAMGRFEMIGQPGSHCNHIKARKCLKSDICSRKDFGTAAMQ